MHPALLLIVGATGCAEAPEFSEEELHERDAAVDSDPEESSDASRLSARFERDASASEPAKSDAASPTQVGEPTGGDAAASEPGPGLGELEDAATSASGVRDAGARDASVRDGGVKDAATRDAARTPEPRDAGRDAAPTTTLDASVSEPEPEQRRSVGCGKSATGNDGFDSRGKSVGGRSRSYHVRVPASYDKSRAYPLVFRWHGSGGNGLSGGLGIEYAAGQDAIIVGANGINAGWTSSTQDNDLLLFDAIYEELAQQYCIDLERVFAYGFSAGGGFTNALGCKRADKVRATAAIAGFDRGDDSCSGAPVAAWFRHDQNDPSVNISEGRGARDRMLARNGCSAQSTTRDGCVSYGGCESGHPVVWCETSGLGHDIAGDSAPGKVWQFFSTLP